MPANYKPLRNTYSARGPPPWVGFRRRTDNMDMVEGRLTSREVDIEDIPTDNIGQEILRGVRETSGRRLPRHDREVRTEENQFPYRHPMTKALANKEKTANKHRRTWYERDKLRKKFLERKEAQDRRIQNLKNSGTDARERIEFLEEEWEDEVRWWWGQMNWKIDYNPEHPEKFPNYRREEDDDEEGPGNAPWAKTMSLSQKYGLDGTNARDRY